MLALVHFKIKKKPDPEEVANYSKMIKKPGKWLRKYAPDFEIVLLNGEKFILSENIGKKVVVLNFFTSWCEPCKKEIPELNRFCSRYPDEELVFIGINGNEEKSIVEAFVRECEMAFPAGIDTGREIMEKYGVASYPTTILIGHDGKIALYEVGMISNADITFGVVYEMHKKIINMGRGIKKEDYLRNLKTQKIDLTNEPKKEGIKLTGRAKDFSKKLFCPGCKRPLSRCSGSYSKNTRKKLKEMDLENKSDEEILKELFLIKGKEND